MNKFFSPFIGQIKECKVSMRKLRKKIYKHSISNKNKGKKCRDNTDEIMDIMRIRSVPEFVVESLKKRRNFDMSSIKNIVVNAQLPLEEVKNLVNTQQSEASAIYFEHKERMREIKRHQTLMNLERKDSYTFNPVGIFSTTEEEQDQQSEISEKFENSIDQNQHLDQRFYDDFSEQSKQPLFTDHYLHMNNMESSLNSEMALFNF